MWSVSIVVFFFSSRRRHTRCSRDWSSDVCSSDLGASGLAQGGADLDVHLDRQDLAGRQSLARHQGAGAAPPRSEEHTSELQSRLHLVCRLLLEKKKTDLFPLF